nr:retrotransposon protein, putative, unclassified [Tanacetum cinerariifolium]
MGHFARECRAPRSQERRRKESYRQGSKTEEKTPKELMAIDRVGWDWSYMANEGEDHALVADEETPTEFALMANTKSKVFDNSLCSNDCKKNTDSLNSNLKDLNNELSEANNYIYHYKLAVAQLEGRLTEYKEREVKYIEKIRTIEMYRASNLKSIKALDKELEEVKLEKDRLDGKLAGLLKASKNLNHLIESQRSDQVKEGVGYNAVPPPAADLYLSPKKDLSWTGLPEFVDNTVTNYGRPSPTVESTSAEGQIKDSSTSEDVASPNPSKPFVKTPRQYNMFSIDLNNIVPHKDLTCLVAKTSADECILWHRRLVYQIDVKSAFFYGIIDEEVYVMQPLGFQDPEFPATVYKVEKAMYGLHQAPRV